MSELEHAERWLEEKLSSAELNADMVGEHGLAFDTEAWRQLRDKKLAEWIQDRDALALYIQFGDIAELFDDVVDGDKQIPKEHAYRVLWTVLCDMPVNRFFEKWKHQLIPIMITGINAWQDANEIEDDGTRNERVFSYVLRDWYFEILSFMIHVLHGRERMRQISREARHFFYHHETLEQYLGKLK